MHNRYDMHNRYGIHNRGEELMIVMHEEEGIERFDLLILVPGFSYREAIPFPNILNSRRLQFAELEDDFNRWVTRQSRDLDEQVGAGSPVGDLQGLLETIAELVGPRLIEELAEFQPYSILISGKPRTIPTSSESVKT